MSKNILPKAKKSIKNYIMGEDGKISKQSMLTLGAFFGASAFASIVSTKNVQAQHVSHGAHCSHSSHGSHGSHSAHGSHSSHVSHGSHGSHASHSAHGSHASHHAHMNCWWDHTYVI